MEDKVRWTITLTAALVLAVACVLGLGISAAVGATTGSRWRRRPRGPS